MGFLVLGWSNNGSPCCQDKRVVRRLTQPEVAERFAAAGLELLDDYVNSTTPLKYRCMTCGYMGTTANSSVQQGHGCRACGYQTVRRKLMDQKTDLEKIEALYAAANVTPLEPWVNAGTPRLVRCNKCGDEHKVRYSNIYSGQGGCRPCARALIGQAQRVPLNVIDAVLGSKNLERVGEYLGGDNRLMVRCLECGSQNGVLLRELTNPKKNRSGCRDCGYRKMGESKVLPAEIVDQAFAAAMLEPLEPYVSATTARLCRCLKCGRQVSPAYNSIQQGQGGCKYCAPGGLDRTAPGVLYLMLNSSFATIKIGVTSTKARRRRIEAHTEHGWELVHTWSFDDAAQAELIETAVLWWWRKTLGAPIAMRPVDMPQAGYSETAALVHVTIEETIDFVDSMR